MALTAQLMASMDDAHLVAALLSEMDSLTSTDTERELLARVERLLDEQDPQITAVVEDFEIEADDLRAVVESHPANLKEMAELLGLLNDEEIHDADSLKALIAFRRDFQALANDMGDTATRLSTFITNAQE